MKSFVAVEIHTAGVAIRTSCRTGAAVPGPGPPTAIRPEVHGLGGAARKSGHQASNIRQTVEPRGIQKWQSVGRSVDDRPVNEDVRELTDEEVTSSGE